MKKDPGAVGFEFGAQTWIVFLVSEFAAGHRQRTVGAERDNADAGLML